MKRKLASIVLSAVLVVGLMPAPALASDAQAFAAGSAKTLSVQASNTVSVQASSNTKYKTGTYRNKFTVSAGGAKVKAVQMGSAYNDPYKITMKKGGKTKTLVKNVDRRFATNGRYVFYAKRGKAVSVPYGNRSVSYYHTFKNTVYRLDTKTGKKVKLGSGTDWIVYSGNGSYCYCGRSYTPPLGSSAYAVNIKTKKKRAIESFTSDITQCDGKRILLSTISMSLGSMRLYSYKLNGKGGVTIADYVCYYKVKGKTVTYLQYGIGDRYCVFQCSITGGNRVALTDWESGWQSVDPLATRFGLK